MKVFRPIEAIAWGRTSRPGLDRREAEPDLVEQRKQERDTAKAKPGEEPAAHGRPERAESEQAEIEQREGRQRRRGCRIPRAARQRPPAGRRPRRGPSVWSPNTSST